MQIPISLRNDDRFELTEQVTVRISTPDNTVVTIGNSDGVLTIFDNDRAPTITINDVTVDPEGDSNGTVNNPTLGDIKQASFTITRAGKTSVATNLTVETFDGSATGAANFAAGVDYQDKTQSFNIPASDGINIRHFYSECLW